MAMTLFVGQFAPQATGNSALTAYPQTLTTVESIIRRETGGKWAVIFIDDVLACPIELRLLLTKLHDDPLGAEWLRANGYTDLPRFVRLAFERSAKRIAKDHLRVLQMEAEIKKSLRPEGIVVIMSMGVRMLKGFEERMDDGSLSERGGNTLKLGLTLVAEESEEHLERILQPRVFMRKNRYGPAQEELDVNLTAEHYAFQRRKLIDRIGDLSRMFYIPVEESFQVTAERYASWVANQIVLKLGFAEGS